MELSPYLTFNGNCAEAFTFYAQCLGGTIGMMQTHGESPMKDQVPPDWRDKVLHVRMTIGSYALMGSDAPPQHYSPGKVMSVSLNVDSYSEGERIFKGLSENGQVSMPYQKTFWAAGFGMATDRFGIPWMVNCEKA